MKIQQGTSKTPSLTPHYMDALLAGQQIHELIRTQEKIISKKKNMSSS
jgi:hypothetical protein